MTKRRLVIFLLLLSTSVFAQSAGRPGYLDPTKPIEQRITDLLGRLTLEEKAAQLNHLNTGVPRLNIPMWGGWNQTLHGVWSKEPTTLFPAAIAMGATWDPAGCALVDPLFHKIGDLAPACRRTDTFRHRRGRQSDER